jgi:hypothetical protein
MQVHTPTDALVTTKRPRWLLLSFGAALLLCAGAATFFGQMMHSGLKDAVDDFGAMGSDFWNGLVRVVGSSLIFLTLASTIVSEMRAVFGTSVAAAAYQAKLWRQARRVVVVFMGLVILSSFTATVIPGGSQILEISLIGAFILVCYVSSTHAKWLSLLQSHEASAQGSTE